MRRAGSETAIVGKWHLASEPAAFDFYCVLPGQGSYFNPTMLAHPDTAALLPPALRREFPEPLPAWPKNSFRIAGQDSTYADDAITDLAIAWLKQRKEPRKPFFLMHHFKGPHDNFENAERHDFLYDETTIPEPASLRERGRHGPLDAPQYGTSVSKRNPRRNMGHHMFVDQNLDAAAYTTASYQRYLKKYLRTLRGVDDNVARLLAHLAESGELDNMVIVYPSDRGFMLGEHDPRASRQPGALRDPHPRLQADLLLRSPARCARGGQETHATALGALRPAARSPRDEQRLCGAGSRRHRNPAQGSARAIEA